MSDIFLNRTNPIQQLNELQSKLKANLGETEGPDFREVLSEVIQDVDSAQKLSDGQIEKVLSGEIQDVHSVMIAMQKADLSFQMMLQVRNKLIDAYQEVMRMQI